MAEPQTYSAEVIASLVGISVRRVQQLADEGVMHRARRNEYLLGASVRGYCQNLRDRAAGKESDPETRNTARTRILMAQAEQAEIQLAKLRDELVSAETVELLFSSALSLASQKFASLTQRIRQRHPDASPRLLDDITNYVNEALAALSVESLPGDIREALGEGDGEVEAAPEDEAVGLG